MPTYHNSYSSCHPCHLLFLVSSSSSCHLFFISSSLSLLFASFFIQSLMCLVFHRVWSIMEPPRIFMNVAFDKLRIAIAFGNMLCLGGGLRPPNPFAFVCILERYTISRQRICTCTVCVHICKYTDIKNYIYVTCMRRHSACTHTHAHI